MSVGFFIRVQDVAMMKGESRRFIRRVEEQLTKHCLVLPCIGDPLVTLHACLFSNLLHTSWLPPPVTLTVAVAASIMSGLNNKELLPTSSSPASSAQQSAPPNPLLTAYENFVSTTPFVTRYLFFVQVITYLLSKFLPVDYALANFPQFTLFQFELYRLLTSPLANTSLFDVLLAYFIVVPVAKKLECSMGSVQLGCLCGSLAFWSNVAFLVMCSVLYVASSSETWLVQSTGSIWIVAFGLLAVEALQAEQQSSSSTHSDSHRRVCFFTVPTRYFPVAFCLLFSIMSLHVNLGLFLSLALGYAIGGLRGNDSTAGGSSTPSSSSALASRWIDPWNVNASSRAQQWETSNPWLSQWSSRVGWVSSRAATGPAAWTIDPPGQHHSNGGSSDTASQSSVRKVKNWSDGVPLAFPPLGR